MIISLKAEGRKGMEEKKITILNDDAIESGERIKLHVTYNNNLTLKELSEVLNLTNKAINDVNREKGINNVIIGREYAPEVSGIESGSIILYIVLQFVTPVALSVLASFIYDRLTTNKKKDNKQLSEDYYPISINVNGSNNSIDIHIEK